MCAERVCACARVAGWALQNGQDFVCFMIKPLSAFPDLGLLPFSERNMYQQNSPSVYELALRKLARKQVLRQEY